MSESMTNSSFAGIRIAADENTMNINKSSFWILMGSQFLVVLYGIFMTLYFSRLVGFVLTFFLDKYFRLSKNGIYFRIGSVSISGLHVGKVMFRNVVYSNSDYVMKINDGYFIFKFWKPIESRQLRLQEKRSSRFQLSLNGLQLHVFNNVKKYSEIARIYQANWFFENSGVEVKRPPKPPDSAPPSSVWENLWNALGIIELDVSSGCFLAGNKLLPYAFWLRFENLTSKISVSESRNDRALLTWEGETESFSASLVKNTEYKATENVKEPPRTTGDNDFPLLQTASLQFTFKQDALGYVIDDQPQSIDTCVPEWTSEWKFHDNTVVSYGPWAEQQRALLYNFFFPPDYQNTPTTVLPRKGQKRIHIRHEAKIVLLKETCVDMWFVRGEQLESIRTRCGPNSTIDFSIMWIVAENGFNWSMDANFVKLETTTSLLFTKFLECDKLNVQGSFDYSKVFNGEQTWRLNYMFSKATVWFVWDHKRFFTDLINDWMGDDPSDIIKFIPFRVYNKLSVIDSFEVILLLNECNWVDAVDKNEENVQAAIVGEKLLVDFELPFLDFLPELLRVKYTIRAEGDLAIRTRYPPDSATSPMLAALSRAARTSTYSKRSIRGNYSLDKENWFEIWRTELAVMAFDHAYHPLVGKLKSTLPDHVRNEFIPKKVTHPWQLAPDHLNVDMTIEGSEVQFTGLLVKIIFELKNNYFGWYDSMTNIDSYPEDVTKVKSACNRVPPNTSAELYRPMDVDVTVRVCNVRAQMLVYSSCDNVYLEKCPVVMTEEIVVEVRKTMTQSLIQVGVAPAAAYFDNANLNQSAGCLTLSGLQFRGQALYSSRDVAWDIGLVEYGWLMEIIVGDVGGTIDFPSHALVLHQLLETILIFVLSLDDDKVVPLRTQFCQHGQLSWSCTVSRAIGGVCETEDKQKYRQLRLAIDDVNLVLVQEKTVLQLVLEPLRFTLCNAHESRFVDHICLRLPRIVIKQAIFAMDANEKTKWLECGSVEITKVSLDIDLPQKTTDRPDLERVRRDFACAHDESTKRLHFLWAKQTVWGCACFGNTYFFGDVDTMGSVFLDHPKCNKLFQPGIEPNPSMQPMVLQSIMDRRRSMLLGQQHAFFRPANFKEESKNLPRRNSDDTASFHSAQSQQYIGSRLSSTPELMSSYSEFVHNLNMQPTEVLLAPAFGEPGAIEQWCQAHQPAPFNIDQDRRGINDVHLLVRNKTPNTLISTAPKTRNVYSNEVAMEFDSPQVLTRSSPSAPRQRRIAVKGVAATSINVFFSPLGLESLESLVTAVSETVATIHPCLLVQMCYRDCVLRKHRQPLIETLFHDDETPPELDISVDLPQIHAGLFQCGLRKNLTSSSALSSVINDETVTANLALVLIDSAWVRSQTISTSDPPSTAYQLSCSTLSAQLLQLTSRDGADFGSQGSLTTASNWDDCVIASRMKNCEPRVMVDFNIPDVSVFLERRPILVQAIIRMPVVPPTPTQNRGSGAPQPTPTPTGTAVERPSRLSNVFGSISTEKISTASAPAASAATPTGVKHRKRVQRLAHEHFIKAVIGSVNTSVVMARPQEMTAGDEFPIYEALSPVMVSWLAVTDNFVYSLGKMTHGLECWSNVAMAKVCKLALECTDEDKVTVRCGKNRMLPVKVLGQHQASCASCLLLHTLFRWFAYSKTAETALSAPLVIRPEFEPTTTRKSALMALLSHWQPDIGRHLKLASYDEASKFKVNPVMRSPAASVASKSRRSEDFDKHDALKKSESKKETKIVIDNYDAEEGVKARTSNKKSFYKAALDRITPPALRKRFGRRRAGKVNENDDDELNGVLLEEGLQEDEITPLPPSQFYFPPQEIEKMHREHEQTSRKKFEEFGRMVKLDDVNSGDALSKKTNPSELKPEIDESKMDLYTWMRIKEKPSSGRARASGYAESMSVDLTGRKDYINPMDIEQKAFFYSLYRWARLEWFALDGVGVDRIHLEYSILVKEVDVRMLAKRVKHSTDQVRQFITAAQHQVMQVRNAALTGLLLWQLERDEHRRLPVVGQWTVNYSGSVDGIRFLIGLATVSLGKELSLVMQTAAEAHTEIQARSASSTPQRRHRRQADNLVAMSPVDVSSGWDQRVLDMTRDYEKNPQRMSKFRADPQNVFLFVSGTANVASVVLESMLTDLYVSVMLHKIDLTHTVKPSETVRSGSVPAAVGVTVTAGGDDRKATVVRKLTTTAGNAKCSEGPTVHEIFLSLAKASLALSEADSASTSKKADIFRCLLGTSSLIFCRQFLPPVNVSQCKLSEMELGTKALLKLGALVGVMPMAAHSVHDLVMRHGKELEQQLNRLVAQPPGTISTASTMESNITSKSRTAEEASQKVQPFSESTLVQTATTSRHTRMPSQIPPHMSLSRRPVAVVRFVIEVSTIEMNIQLLPSLQAKYFIYNASSSGVTGNQANWNIIINEHFFEFCVTAQGGKVDTFRLQLPSVKCTGRYTVEQGTAKHKPSTDKKLLYREGGFLHTTVLLGQVNHTFTTDLLNQLLFAEQSFRSEFTSLINRIRPSLPTQSAPPTTMAEQGGQEYASDNVKPPLLFSIKVQAPEPMPHSTDKSPWLQLTATTPTHIAVRLTIDSLEGELTNKWVVKEEGSKERIYGSAVVHFNAKLGQFVKAAQYQEVKAELQEFATFMTQVRVENKERNLNSSYSYHISLNRPILLVKASAIDKAILLWLNYKSTYDYWRAEKKKVVDEVTTNVRGKTTSQSPMFPQQLSQDVDMNLSLAINNGMYMCMPLYSYDVTEGMPALVISLQKSELSVLVKRELACQASFESFKLSFIDDFDEQALSESFREATGSMQTNYFYFPQGSYRLCSKASANEGPATWVLSVCAEMKGVVIDLDQRIGKLAKMLVNTFSMFGEDEDEMSSLLEDHRELDSDEEKVEGAAELAQLKVEDRVPWMENRMHQRSRAVFELVAKGASQKKLEAETQKLRQLELIRFKEFRKNVVEKLQRADRSNVAPRKRRDSVLSTKAKEVVANVTSSTQQADDSRNELETVNFNVDVKVSIDSGNCTLRTAKQEGLTSINFGGGKIAETVALVNRGTRDIKAMFEPPVPTTTNFSIPSVEIKAYYVSDQNDALAKKTAHRFVSQSNGTPRSENVKSTSASRKSAASNLSNARFRSETTAATSSVKRGCYYMFVGLASMPTETVVTPHLATYLEQMLEPLPPSSVFRSSQAMELDTENTAYGSSARDVNNIVAMDTAALPIDIMLYLDVQSSTIRFVGKKMTSRNQSTVDCLLTLPRLTLELTTRRTEENGFVGGMDISGQFKAFMLSIYSPHQDPTSQGALRLSLDYLSFVISRSKNTSSEADNRVRFVLTTQIGKATFDYDMRRLGELIQFPKPWYRATIARRVFFGDQSAPRPRDDVSDATGTTRSRVNTTHSAKKSATNLAPSTVSNESSKVPTHSPKPWFATVLIAVQWKEFDVSAQMSNTMGMTKWKARKGLLSGNAKLNSKSERDVNLKFKLGSSELRACEGAISGDICLNKLLVYAGHTLYGDLTKAPKNELKLGLQWLTTNVEWMSRRVFIGKWTQPSLVITDYYIGDNVNGKLALSSLGLNVKSSWDDLQVVIMRTTIEDFRHIVVKLTTFFQEQLKNSRLMWGLMETSRKKVATTTEDHPKPTTHYWERVMDYVSMMQFRQQLMGFMEKEGTTVGGTVELCAGKITLVFMQGDMNANCWAVFHLKEANIVFAPQAKFAYFEKDNDRVGILLNQRFVLRLGKDVHARGDNLASVCRVQTRHNTTRQQASIDMVLEYLVGDVLKGIENHSHAHGAAGSAKKHPVLSTHEQASPATAMSPPAPGDPQEHHKGLVTAKSAHNVLELFQFPALEAVMTTRQFNPGDDGDGYVTDSPMEVFATFVCDFHDEVAIETDFSVQVSFLPELLKSYMQKPTVPMSAAHSSSSAEQLSRESSSAKGSDPRIFICEKWVVEPKIRFIDRIKWKPPVVDDVLRKLQIFDHRNTIPKVIQRAVLDPLDAFLATGVSLTLHLIDAQRTIIKLNKTRTPTKDHSREQRVEATPSLILQPLRPSTEGRVKLSDRKQHRRNASDGRNVQNQ